MPLNVLICEVRMTKLITLKDIDFISCTAYFSGSSWECLDKEVQKAIKRELRQEAIKWIREFEIELQPIPTFKIFGGNHFRTKNKDIIIIGETEIQVNNITKVKIRKILIAWIKHFFDITEEDLK